MSSNDMENIMIDEEEHEDVEENSLTPSEVEIFLFIKTKFFLRYPKISLFLLVIFDME